MPHKAGEMRVFHPLPEASAGSTGQFWFVVEPYPLAKY